jgi:hypothetical protein
MHPWTNSNNSIFPSSSDNHVESPSQIHLLSPSSIFSPSNGEDSPSTSNVYSYLNSTSRSSPNTVFSSSPDELQPFVVGTVVSTENGEVVIINEVLESALVEPNLSQSAMTVALITVQVSPNNENVYVYYF